MRIIVPKTITTSIVTACNVAEDDAPEWSAVTTYAKDTKAMLGGAHKVYRSAVDGNVGHDPLLTSSGTPLYWIEEGYTNRWKMFDPLASTQCEKAEQITVSLDAKQTSAVFLSNLVGREVTATLKKGNGEVLTTETVPLITRPCVNFWELIYAPFKTRTTSLCYYPFRWDSTLELTISNPGGTAKVGRIIFGEYKYTGLSQYDIQLDNKDFSTVEEDSFGVSTIVPREKVARVSCTIFQAKEAVSLDHAYKILTDVQSKPTVWDFNNASTNYECLRVFGYSSKTQLNPKGPNWHTSAVEITGMR